MPELPEVETIARCLAPHLQGVRLCAHQSYWAKSLQDPDGLLAAALPAQVRSLGRRAKLLLLRIEPDLVLAFHLKMTGSLLLKPRGEALDQWTRMVFATDSAHDLHFCDVRKFGWCRVLREQQLDEWPFFASLGPEPLECSASALAERLAGRRGAVKALLLNQSVVAGVGNIYADESLFAAAIHPRRPACELSQAERIDLCAALQQILQKAIAGCGTSFRNYVDARGEAGAFQNELLVYGRASQPCTRCGALLIKTILAGRATTFCPDCQF